jgi:hypothetical protein
MALMTACGALAGATALPLGIKVAFPAGPVAAALPSPGAGVPPD